MEITLSSRQKGIKQIGFTLALTFTGITAIAQLDPNTAPKVPVDRFSSQAGMLMVRDGSNGLPAANAPIDYDQAPFITKGLGPSGENVEYYNFDVKPTKPAPIFVLMRTGETVPVANQLNIIDVKPGDAGYNDFWHVQMVTVPQNYVANTATSLQDIITAGYSIQTTSVLVNCPVVPEGSTATKRLNGGDATLTRGWYKDSLVFYFNFVERQLTFATDSMVPTAPIYVTFKINPGEPGGGPASGFVTETGSSQTHNVISVMHSQTAYSPLWRVNVYHNTDFNNVSDLSSANSASILATGVADVNCPLVSVSLPSGIADKDRLLEGSIYPNPVNNAFTLKLETDGTSPLTISIIDLAGRTGLKWTEESGSHFSKRYDVSPLNSGFYFVVVNHGGKTLTRKLIKE